MTVYLYAKQHNATGLRYFGKTTRDPYKYIGSGLYWRNHIKEHGRDVTTTWVHAYEDESIANEEAVFFSRVYNIVNSDEWANLIPEDARGGGRQKGCKGTWAGKKRPEHAALMRERMKGDSNPMSGQVPWNKGLTKEDPRVLVNSQTTKSKAHPGNQFGKGNLGKIQDAEWRRKKSEAAKANWAKRKEQKEQV